MLNLLEENIERVFKLVGVDMEELISVIVPVHNVEKYIKQCIDSIINQTYKNIEIILINDGSEDKSGEICDNYKSIDERISVFHQENKGVSVARNFGIDKSKGQWITFVDSDDWVEKNYIEILLKSAKQVEADVSICGYNRVWNENASEKINASEVVEIFGPEEYLIKSLNPQTGLGFCHMKLFHRSAIDSIRFDSKLIVAEDALFNILVSKNISKAIHCMLPLYNYRNNANSVVKRYDDNYVYKYLTAMKVVKEYLESNYKNDEIMMNYYNFVAYHVILIAVNYCYHPENNLNTKEKKECLKSVCSMDIYQEGIQRSNYQNISLTRKITLFTLKHKLYSLTGKICKYRQKKNRKK